MLRGVARVTKSQVASYGSFEQITSRLDEIIVIVKDKNTSLERSLDLFDEAIALGSKAVDMVDMTDFTAEKAKLHAVDSRLGWSDGSDGVTGADASGVSNALDGDAPQRI